MEAVSLCSGTVTLERIVCSMRDALVVETALVAEKCLFWLILAIGSLPNDVFPKVCQNDESFPLPIVNRVGEANAENDDAGKTKDGADHQQCDYDDQDDDDNDNMSVEEGSDNGDGDPEDDAANGDSGSNDRDEGDDDDDHDDGYWQDDKYEEDEEEYEEDDDEEAEIARGSSKKHKSVATGSEDTTGSEYDDDTDDDDDDDTDEDDPGYGSLLRHAREVYTLTSFHIFENEYKKSKTLDIDVTDEGFDGRGLVFKYKLEKTGHYFREHIVTAWPCDGIIDCSCKYFDSVGILCCHALKVLGCLRIEKIPDHHILKTQTKNGTSGIAEEPQCLIENHKQPGSSSPDCINDSRLTDTGSINKEGSEDDLDMHIGHVDAPLVKHAKDIYISNIFFMFREEYKKSEYLLVWAMRETSDHRGLVFDCEVGKPRHSRYHKVHAETADGRVNCSCKGFENTGILCSHALRVLDCLFIERIPTQYILEKFMKNPGDIMVEDIHGQKYAELAHFIRFKILHSLFESLINLASKSDKGQSLLYELYDKLHVMFGDMSSEEKPSETDEASMITCERERARDMIHMNELGSTKATDDKGMKKTTGLNCDQTLLNCNNEELETKKGRSATTGGASIINSSSPSECHTSQPTNVESTRSNLEAFNHNKNR